MNFCRSMIMRIAGVAILDLRFAICDLADAGCDDPQQVIHPQSQIANRRSGITTTASVLPGDTATPIHWPAARLPTAKSEHPGAATLFPVRAGRAIADARPGARKGHRSF